MHPFASTARTLAASLSFTRPVIRDHGLVTWLPNLAHPKMTGLRLVEDGIDLWLDETKIEFRPAKVTLSALAPIVEARVTGEISQPWYYALAHFDVDALGFVADALEYGRQYEEAEMLRNHTSALTASYTRIYAD